ncbi:MAG: Beta-lactamase superfamily domain [Alphaproteobacteria bacterium]|nr:Beta-lactamase superfamily domain [Alphaproteobacteria bacterium]
MVQKRCSLNKQVTLEILGSGGATTIPKPLCGCKICEEARQKGYPYKRTAPSVFIHGPDILFDTPEEIKYQLERAQVKNINACFYSHWHPDHTAGSRLWEINKNGRRLPKILRTTPIYLASNVDDTFSQHGLRERFDYYQKNGWTQNNVIALDQPIEIFGLAITSFQMAEEYAVGFDIRVNNKKILLIMDETCNWQPPEKYRHYDLVIMPTGITEFHPLTGQRQIPLEHPILKTEPSFENTLAMIEILQAKRVILSHIEEGDGLSHDDWQEVQAKLAEKNIHIDPAFDGMKIDL